MNLVSEANVMIVSDLVSGRGRLSDSLSKKLTIQNNDIHRYFCATVYKYSKHIPSPSSGLLSTTGILV